MGGLLSALLTRFELWPEAIPERTAMLAWQQHSHVGMAAALILPSGVC
jgi:ABC-type antimicrobial peptide transport system ATPase subunit